MPRNEKKLFRGKIRSSIMIGRKKEIQELKYLYNKEDPQLVAIYGRRRVGKTYLIEETFSGQFTFKHVGISPLELDKNSMKKTQIEYFYKSLLSSGMEKTNMPESWLEAFYLLEKFLESRYDGSKQIVFLDELPWLDTPRSGFIQAFEAFWNSWAAFRKNLMVIVCGSANSWIVSKLINNHGGLYDRVTYEIKLSPFTLAECEEYYKQANIKMSRYDITQSYMIMGGIPYYMGYMKPNISLAQNIDNIFFAKGAKLKFEYDRLFSSVFNNPNAIKDIVNILSEKAIGFTRNEIIAKLNGPKSGGGLTNDLNALIASDFVIKYVPFGCSKRQEYYKLTDPLCLFYNRFMKNNSSVNENFWQENVASQAISSWRGLAFENVCFNHVKEIKMALGISGVSSYISSWMRKDKDKKGHQADMLIVRKDNIVNMCEMKFYSETFRVDKDYYLTLLGRQNALSGEISKKSVVLNTLVTTFGLEYNEYFGIFNNVITLDDLFFSK